jgi:type I restriction enzyme R subunit
MSPLNEADTRAKLIDPAIHKRGWTEDLIRREETAGNPRVLLSETKTRMFAA